MSGNKPEEHVNSVLERARHPVADSGIHQHNSPTPANLQPQGKAALYCVRCWHMTGDRTLLVQGIRDVPGLHALFSATVSAFTQSKLVCNGGATKRHWQRMIPANLVCCLDIVPVQSTRCVPMQHVLLMRKNTKDSRRGPESVAASYISNRSEGHKSLASLASMMSEKVHDIVICLCITACIAVTQPTPFFS